MEARSSIEIPRIICDNCSYLSNFEVAFNASNPEVCNDDNSSAQTENPARTSDCCNDGVRHENELFATETQTRNTEDITPTKAAALIEANKENGHLVIIDVSTKKEYLKWHLEKAVNLNFFSLKFRQKLDKLDKNKTYLVYCKMGGRSKMAQKMMKHIGFREVYNIVGGRDRWQAEELPFGTGLTDSSRLSFCPIFMTVTLFRKLKKSLNRIYRSPSPINEKS